MPIFIVSSAQTGHIFGAFEAETGADALDQFARSYGYADCKAMWAAGTFEYVTVS